MEQKRTLWVIAASGVFLLVVVGAAVILYSPSVSKSQAAQAAVNPNNGWTTPLAGSSTALDPFSLSPLQSAPTAQSSLATQTAPLTANAPVNPFENSGYQGNELTSAPIQTGNVTVIADNTTVYGTGTTTIDLNALKTTVSPNVTAQNAVTQAQIEQTQSLYETRSVTAASEPKEDGAVSQKKSAPARTAPAKAVAQAPKAKSAPASTKKADQKPAAKKIADKFWVQAASYASKKSADDARETLESNKIPSEVFTYTDAKGKVFYRVRVGPYTTSSEAEYWKTQVAKIDRFADSQSYIVNSSAKAVK